MKELRIHIITYMYRKSNSFNGLSPSGKAQEFDSWITGSNPVSPVRKQQHTHYGYRRNVRGYWLTVQISWIISEAAQANKRHEIYLPERL